MKTSVNGKEIYRNLTSAERTQFVEIRKEQGRGIARVIWPVVALSFLFVLFGRIEVKYIIAFVALCTLSLFRLPRMITATRRHNRKWLAETGYAKSKQINESDISL